MKKIYKIMTSVLLLSLSPHLHSTDKSVTSAKSVLYNHTDNNLLSDSSNRYTEQAPHREITEKEKSRQEQTKQNAGKLELVIQNGHSAAVNGILLTKDEKKMISYSADGTIKIWDVENRKLIRTLEGHKGLIVKIYITKEEEKIISESNDGDIKIWDFKEGKLLYTFNGVEKDSFSDMKLIRNDTILISSFMDKTIKIWDINKGTLIKSIETDEMASEVQISRDEGKIFFSDRENIKIYDTGNWKLLKALPGHSSYINKIQLSNDGRKIISQSHNGKIIVWDIGTLQMINVLVGHTAYIKALEITKDQRKMISYSADKTIKIWDLDGGKLIKSLEYDASKVNGIILSKKQSSLISYSNDGMINVWSLEDGKLLKSMKGHTDGEYDIILAQDPERIISCSKDKTLKIWDAEKGLLLKSLVGHTSYVQQIQLTKDGKKIISYSADGIINVWDIDDGNLLKTFQARNYLSGIILSKDSKTLISFTNEKSIEIWNLEDDKLHTLFEGHTRSIISSDYIHSKRAIYINSDFGQDIWDLNIGKIKINNLERYTNSAYDAIELIKNDEFSITYGRGKDIKVWDIKNNNLRKSLEGHSHMINGIVITKNEKRLISFSWDKTVKIWDLENYKLLHSLEGHTENVWGIRLTRDEKKIISYSMDNTVRIWNMEDGKQIGALLGHTNWIQGIQLTQDEKKLITYSGDGTVKIWNLYSYKLLYSLESHTDAVYGIRLTNNEKRIISYSSDKTMKIWDLEAGKLLGSTEGQTDFVDGILLSHKNDKIISFSNNEIRIWNLDDGKLSKIMLGHSKDIIKIHLARDEKKLISFSKDNTIKFWDIETGKCLQTLNHNSSYILQIIFKEDPTNPGLLLSISSDGSLRYWNIETGKLLITQLLFKNGHSIYYTPEGYFDYTDKSVLDYISFVSPNIQNSFVDLQDLMNGYHVDGLLELVTENKFKPNRRNSLTRGVKTAAVVKALFETQQSVVSEEDRKTLQFQITERGSNFERAVVYVNGIQVDEKKLVEGEKTEGVTLIDDSTEGYYKYRVEFDVPLNFGTNRVEVKAYNSYNIPQSFPVFEIQRKIPEDKELAKPDLYILSVGINNYKNNKLTYSVPDAKAMAEALEQGKEGIYHHVFTKLLVDAKRQEIADALTDIERKARPQDVVLIYFSGHGMNAFTTEGKKLFYFVPQDFRWPDDPENGNVARLQGIDADYLDETFTKIKSHKLILILDACHSGSVNAALASRGQDKEKATRRAMEKMANGTGRFIFASSSGNEESREHKDVGHGLYTYVLLNALGKNKDRNIADADSINKDGYIYLSEIRSYMEQQFEEQTAKYLKGVIQSPPSMSLGRNGMHERVNDFPLLKVR